MGELGPILTWVGHCKAGPSWTGRHTLIARPGCCKLTPKPGKAASIRAFSLRTRASSVR